MSRLFSRMRGCFFLLLLVSQGNWASSQVASARSGDHDLAWNERNVIPINLRTSRRLHESDNEKDSHGNFEDDGWDEGGESESKGESVPTKMKSDTKLLEGAETNQNYPKGASPFPERLQSQSKRDNDANLSSKELEEEETQRPPFPLPKPSRSDGLESSGGAISKSSMDPQEPPDKSVVTSLDKQAPVDSQTVSWPAQQPQWPSQQHKVGACAQRSDEAKCSGRGVCMQNGECQCLQGYAGEFCQTQCPRANGQPVRFLMLQTIYATTLGILAIHTAKKLKGFCFCCAVMYVLKHCFTAYAYTYVCMYVCMYKYIHTYICVCIVYPRTCFLFGSGILKWWTALA